MEGEDKPKGEPRVLAIRAVPWLSCGDDLVLRNQFGQETSGVCGTELMGSWNNGRKGPVSVSSVDLYLRGSLTGSQPPWQDGLALRLAPRQSLEPISVV